MGKKESDKGAGGTKGKQSSKEKLSVSEMLASMDSKPEKPKKGQISRALVTVLLHSEIARNMIPQGLKKAVSENPKKVAELIDLVNLPTTLREFIGQSQSSQLNCFKRVWCYIKENNLQDPVNKNVVNCDEKLKKILLGKSEVDLTELPMLVKLHFPKRSK